MLFLEMGFIPWVDEIKFMLISSRHFCIVFDEMPIFSHASLRKLGKLAHLLLWVLGDC